MSVKNILICSTSGQLIINYKEEEEVLMDHDDMLVSALMSAIRTFILSLRGEEIERIETTNLRFIILPSVTNGLIFILISDLKSNGDKALQVLEDIRDEMLEKYGSLVRNDSFYERNPNVINGLMSIAKEVLEKNRF